MFTKMGKFYTRSDIASSTNSKCSLNWKFRHPEWKSFLKENSTRHIFFYFRLVFSVKFAHFGEHFSPKTPMQSVYVCLLLDLLISLYFNRCTIRNTFLTNINLGRLSDIASHCKKYIYIL
jgi:hypothetical protein